MIDYFHFQLLMALLRLDFLAAYLSDPLVSGYTTGAAVQAVSQQLDKVIGVKVQSRPSGLFSVFYVRITFIILNAVLVNLTYQKLMVIILNNTINF